MTDKFREIIPISFLIQRTVTEENRKQKVPQTNQYHTATVCLHQGRKWKTRIIHFFFPFKLLTAWSHWVLLPSLLSSSASSLPPQPCQIHRKGERSTGRGSAPQPEPHLRHAALGRCLACATLGAHHCLTTTRKQHQASVSEEICEVLLYFCTN